MIQNTHMVRNNVTGTDRLIIISQYKTSANRHLRTQSYLFTHSRTKRLVKKKGNVTITNYIVLVYVSGLENTVSDSKKIQ